MTLCAQLSVVSDPVVCLLMTVDVHNSLVLRCMCFSNSATSPPGTSGSGGVETAVTIGVVVAVATVILLIIIVAVFITVLASEGVGDGGECVTCHSSMGQCVCVGHNSVN